MRYSGDRRRRHTRQELTAMDDLERTKAAASCREVRSGVVRWLVKYQLGAQTVSAVAAAAAAAQRSSDRRQRASHSFHRKRIALTVLTLFVAVIGSQMEFVSAAFVEISAQPKALTVDYGAVTDHITCTYTLMDSGYRGRDAETELLKEQKEEEDIKTAPQTNINEIDDDASDSLTDANDNSQDTVETFNGTNDSNEPLDEVNDDNKSMNTTAPVTSRPKITALRFDKVPDFITLRLYDYNAEEYVVTKREDFRVLRNRTLQLKFKLHNVKQSGKFGCDLSAFDVGTNRDMMQVYVRTADSCLSGSDLCASRSETTMCKNGDCVCMSRTQRGTMPGPAARQCLPVVRSTRCYRQQANRACRQTRKFALGPYQKVNNGSRFNTSLGIEVDGERYILPGVERDCYVCTDELPTSRFMTALVVTFLVLVSGAMSIVGAAILYDWCKRRRYLLELEEETREQNTSAVDAEALRRVNEDRPPSYVEMRQSDRNLAGPPPPSYEDVCKEVAAEGAGGRRRFPPISLSDRTLTGRQRPVQRPQLDHAVSLNPLPNASSVGAHALETIPERRVSL